MNGNHDSKKRALLTELEAMRDHGIAIYLDGTPSNPNTITDILCVNEQSVYMRDYVTDEKGVLRELHFDHIDL